MTRCFFLFYGQFRFSTDFEEILFSINFNDIESHFLFFFFLLSTLISVYCGSNNEGKMICIRKLWGNKNPVQSTFTLLTLFVSLHQSRIQRMSALVHTHTSVYILFHIFFRLNATYMILFGIDSQASHF